MPNRLFCTALLGVCLIVAPAALAQTRTLPIESPYVRATIGDLPVEFPLIVAGTHIVVDGVWVNGTGPYRFLVDTGAMGGGRIDTSLAAKLALTPEGEVQASDGSGRGGPTLPEYRLDSLKLGPLEFFDVRMISRDYNLHASAIRGHIDGILGFHLFRELLLTLDYPGGKLRVDRGALPEADGRTVLPLIADALVPSVNIKLAGGEHLAHIDTGSMGGISVGAGLAKSLKFANEPQQVGEARTVSGTFPISVGRLDGDVSIGAHILHQPELTIGEPIRNINLGGRVLEEFALTFDQPNGRVRIVRPDDAVADVPLEMVLGRPVIEASVNGRGPFRFVLDTGSGLALLNRDLITELGLPSTGTTRIGDPAHPTAVEVDTFVLDQVVIGGVQLKSVEAVSWGGNEVEGQLGEVRGVLGLSTFADYLVRFDFPGRRLVVAHGRLRSGDGSVDWLGDDEIPTVELRLGDERVDAHIDTGNAGEFTLPRRLMGLVALTDEPLQATARTLSGEFTVDIATLAGDLQLAGQAVHAPTVQFTDYFDWGNVGCGALAGFALTIDQTSRRILLEASTDRSGSATDSARKPKKRYGMMLGRAASGPLDVVAAIPGSIAEHAGLRRGDRILAINGEDIDGLDMARRGELLRGSPVTLRVQRGEEQLDICMSLDDGATE